MVPTVAGRSHRGLRRGRNEDRYLVARLAAPTSSWEGRPPGSGGHLLAVADGMGGHEDGEVASRLTVETLRRCLTEAASPGRQRRDEEVGERLRRAIESCQQRLRREIDARGHPLGTTLTAACIVWPRLWLGHVGDSRCYLKRRGRLARLTRDHTVAQQLIDLGENEGAATSAFSHLLVRALGGESAEESVELDLHRSVLEPGDLLLLCTDGLTRHLTDSEIGLVLEAAEDPDTASALLVQAALREGGEDNVTVVVACFGAGAPDGEDPDPTAVPQFSETVPA